LQQFSLVGTSCGLSRVSLNDDKNSLIMQIFYSRTPCVNLISLLNPKKFSLGILSLGFIHSTSFAQLPPGIGLQDLADYGSSREASLMQSVLTHSLDNGQQISTLINQWYFESNESSRSGPVETFVGILSHPGRAPTIRKIQVKIQKNNTFQILASKDISLASTHFFFSVGLLERAVLLEDSKTGIKIIFPLGVGGLDSVTDPSRTDILTPLFQNSMIKKSSVDPSVTDPSYYRGLPFLPITDRHGHETVIAFHITILDDSTWISRGGNYLVRGFESHGCMRLREGDLAEMTAIVMGGPDPGTPVNVNLVTPEHLGATHPYPMRRNGYQRIKYFENPGQAEHFKRDGVEHLKIMEDVPGRPPLRSVQGVTQDMLQFLPSTKTTLRW
jgi:hypothetical protein